MNNNEIKDFPEEVVQKMLEHQVEQGNPADRTVFEENARATARDGGFRWSDTPEEYDFWEYVIGEQNFDIFFAKYPKQELPLPRVVEVQNGGEWWYRRVLHFVRTVDGKDVYYCTADAETLKDAEIVSGILQWQYMREIEEPKPKVLELTLDEIAEKYGVSVDQLKIKK